MDREIDYPELSRREAENQLVLCPICREHRIPLGLTRRGKIYVRCVYCGATVFFNRPAGAWRILDQAEGATEGNSFYIKRCRHV